jgi:hypothetical protein
MLEILRSVLGMPLGPQRSCLTRQSAVKYLVALSLEQYFYVIYRQPSISMEAWRVKAGMTLSKWVWWAGASLSILLVTEVS